MGHHPGPPPAPRRDLGNGPPVVIGGDLLAVLQLGGSDGQHLE